MRYTWERVTDSQVVSKSPGFIGSIVIVSNGSGNADATIYDGESAKDPQILKALALDNTCKVIRFQPPLATKRGLYVTIGSNVNEVLVQHAWGKE